MKVEGGCNTRTSQHGRRGGHLRAQYPANKHFWHVPKDPSHASTILEFRRRQATRPPIRPPRPSVAGLGGLGGALLGEKAAAEGERWKQQPPEQIAAPPWLHWRGRAAAPAPGPPPPRSGCAGGRASRGRVPLGSPASRRPCVRGAPQLPPHGAPLTVGRGRICRLLCVPEIIRASQPAA